MRRIFIHPTFLATAIILAIVLLVTASRSQESAQRLMAFEGETGPFEIFIRMPFEPEAFHLTKLQGLGRIAGVEGTNVHLRGVKPDQLQQLSWQPWIASIDPIEADEQP